VAAGVGFPDRSGVLVNLTTGELQDLSSIVVPWSDGGVRNRPEGRGFVCNQFSPQGTYLSAINEDDGQLVIFDATLYISHIINGFGVEDPSQAVIYCPSWNQNETVVYFPVRELTRDITSVFTYSLETEQLSKLYQGTIYPPLEFSPNRSHFVFDLVLPSIARIHVVYPDGEIQLFGDPFQYAQYPIWRPASDQ
jgi:hypothetical protein